MVSPTSSGPRAGRSPPWFKLYRSSLHLVQGSSRSGLGAHIPGTFSSEDPSLGSPGLREPGSATPAHRSPDVPGRKAFCPLGPASVLSLRRCTPASLESLGREGLSPAHEPGCASPSAPRPPDPEGAQLLQLALQDCVTSGELLQHGRCRRAAPAGPRGVKAWTLPSLGWGLLGSAQRKGPEEGGGPDWIVKGMRVHF